ncbi:MAG: lauroyl acyltransferase [Paracoccaceae bacterium]
MSASRTFEHRVTDIVARTLIGFALRLPYRVRVPFMGWMISRVIGRVAHYHKRARTHLAVIFPDKPKSEINRIATACLDNVGRSLIENYSTQDFLAHMTDVPLEGAGVQVLKDAAASGRAVILQTGHFGNYEAARAVMLTMGIEPGGIFRKMHNEFFHEHYVKTMEAYGGPAFQRGLPGMRGVMKHLKSGGQLIILNDQHASAAPTLKFLGKPAKTPLSPAELALRFDAVVLPFFSIRQSDGLSFRCYIEEPIEHSDPETMTQQMNDRLGERILETPEQWFWVPRRWRAETN